MNSLQHTWGACEVLMEDAFVFKASQLNQKASYRNLQQ